MKKRNIWFVIVTYKPDMDTLRRLIAALEGRPIIVVDNAEAQSVKLKAQSYNAKVKYIQNEKNLGYGGGANVGMKIAFDSGAEWTVVVNQDVQLTRKAITQFCAIAQNCDPAIVGPEVGSLDPLRWTTILPSRGQVDYISGSFMAIHRKVWEAIGGFYEPYFMYYEDADLCIRAKKAGFALREVPIRGFRHVSQGNEYYLARNHLLFVLRNAPLFVKLYEVLRLPKTFLELWL